MPFTSLAFLFFFSIVFCLYWFVFKNLKAQNILLLVSSYVFYAYADFRFLGLLILSSAVTYFVGIKIEEKQDRDKKRWANAGVIFSIGILFYFKYFNFFADSFSALLGIKNIFVLQVLLPLGISFYTFRMISYLLDIKNRKCKAERSALIYFNYISFFPSMVSGPIDRANLIIPQLKKIRTFTSEEAADAMRMILLGAFKKLVVANNITPITQNIFKNYETLSGSTIALGVFLFLIEMYADFSGYSDMAIGFAKLLGFRNTKNFAFPLFAQNIAEYWRKWHISLTSWLTEYVFTPLVIALRDYEKKGLIAAIILNFAIIGIWHGPRLTFLLFGVLHGIYYVPLILQNQLNKKKKLKVGQLFPNGKEFLNIIITMFLVCFALVLFVSPDLSTAWGLYTKVFSVSFFTVPKYLSTKILFFIAIIYLLDWFNKDAEHGLDVKHINPWMRRGIYVFLLAAILLYGVFGSNNFIYEQF